MLADRVRMSKVKKDKILSDYSWHEINDISSNGEAEIYFSVGDEKNENINGQVITFQIYGFNHDDISSGKAGITFGMKVTNPSLSQVMNNPRGTSGGWNNSQLRSWMMNTLYNSLPQNLKNVIKEVTKQSYLSSNTNDRLFLFSASEIGSLLVNDGTMYPIFSSDDITRVKGDIWWTRSVFDANRFYRVQPTGLLNGGYTENVYSVVFGFCI